MILLDANILIYAVNTDAPLNRKAKAWLESALSGQETVGFSWNVLLAFLRLTTRPGLFRRPLSVDRAFNLMASWLDQPSERSCIQVRATYRFSASCSGRWARAEIS